MNLTIDRLQQVLLKSYDRKTAYPKCRDGWREDNPAYGQCVPTSLLVQHYFGGEIYKKDDHYFNVIKGEVIDLSRSQFDYDFDYSNSKKKQPSLDQARTQERYELLKERVEKYLIKEEE